MKTLSLADLSKPIRDFLATVEDDQGVMIRDEQGRTVLSITLYRARVVSAEERERALQDLRGIQERVGNRLRDLGVSEEEFDRAIQEGD
jgi:argininosuccinate lyase